MDQKNLQIKIEILKEETRKAWDNYVDKHPLGTFFHLSGWKYAVEKTFGYKSFYIFATKKDNICGILPLFVVKSLLGGKALVSLPFCVYGGVCSDSDDITKLLITEAENITKKVNARYLELRNKKPLNFDMPVKNLYYTFIKELPEKAENCLTNLPRKARAAVRKAISLNLETHVDIKFLKEFYHIYAVSVRNLGSPVLPFSFLKF